MSSSDERTFYDADDGSDLDHFIASSDTEQPQLEQSQNAPSDNESEDEEKKDRVGEILKTLKPNEDYALKVLKAHISVLVSTLGGPDHTSPVVPPPYNLGPDALPCLKDLKRWIQTVDQRNGTFKVALAIADSGLVINDLSVILCDWDRKQSEAKKTSVEYGSVGNTLFDKIALTCLELLVLLTWPFEITKESTLSQKDHFSDLRKAQLVYKKHILNYNRGQTFKAVLRLALPCLSQDKNDREPRDNAILRLVLFFIRNMLYLEPADVSVLKKNGLKVGNFSNLPANVTLEDISLNNVLQVLKKNKVLVFLLTISGGIGQDFDKHMYGNVLLECIHLLVRGLDAKSVASSLSKTKPPPSDPQSNKSNDSNTVAVPKSSTVAGMTLKDLLQEEAKRKKQQMNTISSRHGRFGTLLSLQNNTSSFTISGQEAIIDRHHTLEKLDKSKKWTIPTHFKYDSDKYIQTFPVYINGSSALILREFIEQFLAGGCFNNIITAVSSELANSFTSLSDANMLESIDVMDAANYYSLIAWFFNYKRERNTDYELQNKKPLEDEDQLDYGSVGAALSDVNFVLVGQYLREAFNGKHWDSLHVALICLREMLLISNTIFQRANEEKENEEQEVEDDVLLDRELAEGIIRKLFSEVDYISLLVRIPRTAWKHSPRYLSVVVSVVHILLKSFESFANQDVTVYMKAKRRTTKKKKPEETEEYNNLDSEHEWAESRQEIRERKLDFSKTEAEFFHRDTVTTYITYLTRYEELSNEEIKKALSFFHKLFAVRKDFTGLYRLDFMNTLYRLRNGTPRSSSIRKHVDEFVYYFMKKFKKAFERFPLPVEILFPRFEDLQSKSYLATGQIFAEDVDYGKGIVAEDAEFNDPGYVDDWITEPKKAKALKFKSDVLQENEIEILVACLCQSDKDWVVEWLITELQRIHDSRLLDDSIDVLQPSPTMRRLLITNNYLRLLLERIGFQLPDLQNDPTVLTSSVTNEELLKYKESLQKFHQQHKDEEADSSVFGNLEPARGRGGSKPRKEKEISDEPLKKKKKKKRTRRNRIDDDDEVAGKASGRYNSELVLKSTEFVQDSDDESDEEKTNEFFSREQRLRNMLTECGGIINHEQLLEFKQSWTQLEFGKDANEEILRSFVAQAKSTADQMIDELKEDGGSQTIDFFQGSQKQESDDSGSDEESASNSSDDEEASQQQSSQQEQESQTVSPSATPNTSFETISRKRKVIVDSDEDNDDSELNVGDSTLFMSAEENAPVKRSKFVIQDDDDE